MQLWKFKISGKVLINGDSTDMEIRPENILTLIRISNFRNRNMPMIMIRLNLDKNLFDKIIQNAKTCTMYLKIEKFDKQSEMSNPVYYPYIEDEFSVFVSNDINYNKELDYIGDKVDGKRKDVYKETYLGLVSKKCIDANKSVANSITHNSDIMNIAVSYMTNLHLLIEPFTYNPIESQLIIPPKDTLVKILEFLNSVSVFYDTKYLFFIDEPMCTYLISRSGKGVPKSDEVYNDVLLDVHKVTDKAMANPGMNVDNENNQYSIDISVLDTKYTIDHDTAKIIDRFDAIINPSKFNTVAVSEEIAKAQTEITRIMNNINKEVDKFIEKTKDLPEKMNKAVVDINSRVMDTLQPLAEFQNKVITEAINTISNIPTSVTVDYKDTPVKVPILSDSIKTQFASQIVDNLDIFGKALDEIKEVQAQFGVVSNQATDNSLYNMQNLKKYMGGVTYINAQDVAKETKKTIDAINQSTGSVAKSFTSGIVNKLGVLGKYATGSSSLGSGVGSINSTLQGIKNGIYGSVLPSGLIDSMGSVATMLAQLNDATDIINTQCDGIRNTVNTTQGILNEASKTSNNLSNMAAQLDQIINLNVKSKFYGINIDMRKLDANGGTVFGAISNIWNSVKDGLNIKDLTSIKDNLSKVADIADIGKLGISMFETNLQVGGCFGNGKTGVKIVRSKNDNPNEIKNKKSELETMINQLNVNKFDIDPSVFTPNKKYKVKNYDAHSDKDGIFILNKKTEIYIRDDDTFSCNCMLDLAKIPEQSDTEKARDSNKENVNQTQSTDWYAQSQGNTVDSDKTVNTNNEGEGVLVEKREATNDDFKYRELGSMSLHDTLAKQVGKS